MAALSKPVKAVVKYGKSVASALPSLSSSMSTPTNAEPSTNALSVLTAKHKGLCNTVQMYKSAVNTYRATVRSLESLIGTLEATIPALPASTIEACKLAVSPLKKHVDQFEACLPMLNDTIRKNEATIEQVKTDFERGEPEDDELTKRINDMEFDTSDATMAVSRAQIGELQQQASNFFGVMSKLPDVRRREMERKG